MRKRPGRLGEPVSVYADISTLLDDEEAEVESAREEADREHDRQLTEAQEKHAAAINAAADEFKAAEAAADAWYQNAVGPLQQRQAGLESLREQVKQLAAQNDAALPDPTQEPASSPSTAPDEPTPPTEVPAPEPIPAEQVDFATAPATQPVAVTLGTGEIKVVTVDDIMAAADNDIPTADLTPDQAVLRNSDIP